MIEFFVTNFTEIASSILLACFVAYLVWRNNFKVRQANAASVFRDVFSNSLSQIKHGIDNPFVILKKNFPAHESAVTEFARYLCWFKRKCFLKAWKEYHCYKNTNTHFLEQYTTKGVSIEQGRNDVVKQFCTPS